MVYFVALIGADGRVVTSTVGKSRPEDSVLDYEYLRDRALQGQRLVQVEVNDAGLSATLRNEVKS